MDFEHGIIGFKDRGDMNYVDENLSEHGTSSLHHLVRAMS